MSLRPGFHTITPYLTTPDLDRQLAFLTTVLGAVELQRDHGGGGGVHVELRIGDSMLMVGSRAGAPTTAMLYLYVEDVGAHYAKAIAAGATSIMPPTDTGDGERRAGARDADGNEWFFGRPATADRASTP